MAIFILEDQLMQARYLTDKVQALLIEQGVQQQIHTYYRGFDLLTAAQVSLEPNLYFLDIQIKADSHAGLEVAQRIRQFDKEGLIVFVTTHSELALTSYRYMVAALNFIDKNVAPHIFHEQIAQCLHKHEEYVRQAEVDVFELQTKHRYLKVRWQELYYFEVVGNHLIRLVAHNRTVDYYGTLNELEDKDARLMRVHQAFVIHLDQVKQLDKKQRVIHLRNGAMIPVSRTYYKSFCTWLERGEHA
ncbi:response regulator transcription factor [Aerococcaceae bacterium NML171108]|nr:response regulator transcription factor [Aerococcaceae bacterium NML171108]